MTTHDFTRTTWGHNIEVFNHTIDGGIPRYRVASWSSKRIEVGDEILWKTVDGGIATLIVEGRESVTGVWDMAWLNLRAVTVEEADGTLVLCPSPKPPTFWDNLKAKLKR